MYINNMIDIPNFKSLERMYQPPEWLTPESVGEVIRGSTGLDLRVHVIYRVAGMLSALVSADKLPKDIASIFEFGSGFGEGLISLSMFAKAKGDTAMITGSELDTNERLNASMATSSFWNIAGIGSDGVAVLDSAPEGFDLILAHMFGPSHDDDDMPSIVMPAMLSALKPGGVAIVNSDDETMYHTLSFVERTMPTEQFEQVDREILPEGVRHLPLILLKKQ